MGLSPPAGTSDSRPVTEAQIIRLLRDRHGRVNGNGREWAFFSHVRRTADALAMSMYRSKGHEMHGFEVKVSRSDWLRELKQPTKADAIAGFCNRWWVAVSNTDIVKTGELPPNWGLLVPTVGRHPNGLPTALRAAVRAKPLSPKPLTRDFVACIVRRFAYEEQEAAKHRRRATDRDAFARLEALHDH